MNGIKTLKKVVNKMRSVGILTLGCKVNTYESEYVINILKEHNYEIKSFDDICDVYIINTCTVTNTSDIKSRKMIRNAIKKNPNACVVAMGCFIEANKDYQIEGLDIVLGNKDKSKIVDLLDEYFTKKEKIVKLYNDPKSQFEDMYITNFPGRTRAFVKIQDGCENFCSYCIIPFVRGKCRSKDKDKVISEINALVKNGYQEVVLTGIHTGNYGVDLDTNFATLLKDLVKIEGLKRLRISSIEITELTDEVLEVLKTSPIIVDHLHIPLQAGSDEILKAMNRKYDLSYFFEKIKKIREIRPNISITTDVIVGFPGETTELFEQTIKTCRDLEFAKIHVFPYSERQGTKAMELPNHIESNEKKRRARELLLVSKELEITYANKFLNKQVEVLIEEDKDGYSYGHTSNYLHVKINKKLKHNTFVTVTITKVDYPYCLAK
ncbi:MAG: tRNA (N(6)-L-threonylcarbamoyladenosine(37)-C(2))-methylthiotransferase MtaB [Tenericutes bacterium]|nr:tRNA (N(6)-L-threonylcarbamoyladenosine(37)-C(2))-methylthiotransferase MtaB [Mycoplasmatota bacterium]